MSRTVNGCLTLPFVSKLEGENVTYQMAITWIPLTPASGQGVVCFQFGEMDVLWGSVTCSRFHRKSVAELGIEPWFQCFLFQSAWVRVTIPTKVERQCKGKRHRKEKAYLPKGLLLIDSPTDTKRCNAPVLLILHYYYYSRSHSKHSVAGSLRLFTLLVSNANNYHNSAELQHARKT